MKSLRYKRIFKGDPPKTIIVPMDHGVTSGPKEGPKNMKKAITAVQKAADAIVVHKGALKVTKKDLDGSSGIILHLSASHSFSPLSNSKVLVGEVEEALMLGADGVSVHVNLGDDLDREMIRDLGLVVKEADRWGIPVLAMIYPRGKGVQNPLDPDLVAHGARLGAELGADVVKVPYTGSPESFSKAVEGCFVPVVIAGGPKVSNDKELLKMVKEAMDAGASGLSMGRNIFQHHDPPRILQALKAIVHQGATVDEAMEILEAQP